jgi:CHAT domain-containing protein
LHAAGIYNGKHKLCCNDFVVSSYSPTVTALLRAQRATTLLSRDDVSLAIIAEKDVQQPGLPLLPGVEKEIENIFAIAQSSNVKVVHQQVGSTTITGTSAGMHAANIVHLACHGVQDLHDATQSGVCLSDGRLTIANVKEMKLDNAFLAFLSACVTAQGVRQQPDQDMHLAAAMLFAGFRSLIATMWFVAVLSSSYGF